MVHRAQPELYNIHKLQMRPVSFSGSAFLTDSVFAKCGIMFFFFLLLGSQFIFLPLLKHSFVFDTTSFFFPDLLSGTKS